MSANRLLGLRCKGTTKFADVQIFKVKSVIKSLSFRFLSRNYLVTTSIPIHYHPVLSPYFATYLSAFIRRVNKYSSIVLTSSRVFYFLFVH